MKRLRIGIVGYGALGSAVAAHLAASAFPHEISGFLVRSQEDGDRGAPFTCSFDAFLAGRPDVVIECAGQAALKAYGAAIVGAGIDLVPASVGALVDEVLLSALLPTASSGKGLVRLPSGAMVGIDGLAAACHVGVDTVRYRGTMPPAVLQGFCDFEVGRNGLVFEGSAREAVARFPKNANLTGTIALTGIGFDATRVEMHVDDTATANLHELHASGLFGSFDVSVRGRRISPTSPSSRIVAGSLVQAALGSGFARLSASK